MTRDVNRPLPLHLETMRTRAALERIAATLGVPIDTFFSDGADPEQADAQESDLVAAFRTIRGPDARRLCLAFVRAIARA